MIKDKILIVGGYGAVGRIISQQLSELFRDKIIVAGRDMQKAETAAHEIGHGVQALYLDVCKSSTFKVPLDTKLVVMCLDLSDNKFISHLIHQGVDYMDITASHDVMKTIASLDAEAKLHQVSLGLSIGLAPGVTNLLSKHLYKQFDGAIDNLDIFILLGLGEAHGDKAFKWTFDTINSNFSVRDESKTSPVKSFTDGKQTELLGNRSFYLFDFSDQHIMAETISVKKVRTRLAFDVQILTKAVAWMRRWGLSKIYSLSWVQRMMIQIFKKGFIGTNQFGVKTIVTKGDRAVSAQLTGKEQGRTTALVASLVAQEIYAGTIDYGVQHIHQMIEDVPSFLSQLQKMDASIDWQILQK